jgi:HEAT repeat protein/ubiquinone/menaquinone biosynthesis C-methylase UbiE
MADQAEIHRKAVSGKVEDRREAADQLWDNFAVLPDKKQAWEDLHLLTQDKDWDVRRHAACAIGAAFQHILDKEQAFKDLHELIRDKNGDVQQNAIHALGVAFPYILDKKRAWDDLHQLTQDEDEYAWWGAVHAIRDAFQHIPDKEQAWEDLYRIVQEDSYVWQGAADAIAAAYPHVPDKKRAWEDLQRLAQGEARDMQLRAIYVIGVSFQHITDKEQAWSDLIRLTQEDEDLKVRRKATSALGAAFQYVPDKELAWKYLHELTQDAYSGVQRHAAYALCAAFQHIPDKKHAWEDLLQLTHDEDYTVRRGAANVLANVFPHIPDKELAWEDIYRLIQDGDGFVWRGAAYAIRVAFPYIHDKEHAWEDLHQLTKHDNRSVRSGVVYALVDAFQHIPDKEQIWSDLHWLTQDKYEDVRHRVADVIGIAFQHIPDKEHALEDLHQLTKDKDRGVRMSANHSLGRVYIFKAAEAESEDDFRSELKKALRFFERSLKETTLFNPSEFCLPFYSSFYAITFEGVEAEDEVQRCIVKAKGALRGSKNKEILLEAVENLANALTKVHKAREANLDTIQSDLNECIQHYDRFADLIGVVGGKTSGAARVLQRGGLIIEDQINEILREIHEKSEALYKQTKNTPFEDSGKEIYHIGQSLLQIRNQIELEKRFNNLQLALSDICDKIPEGERRGACKLLKRANEDSYIEDKLVLISMFLSKIPHYIDGGKRMTKIGKIEIKNANIGQIGDGEVTMDISANQKEKSDIISGKRTERNTIPHLSYLESEIYDRFKSVYQKEREEGVSEVNSKTLELLKSKLLDLTESGKEINWLDVGCGDGRCLEVLEDIQNREKIRYHGIDSLHKYLDDAEERARGYGIIATFDKTNAAVMDFDSEYDVVSAVLLLHEVDPLGLPYVLRNMLKALKDDETLVISDFQEPYEQECDVVVWNVEDITHLLEKIGVTWIKIEFIQSKQYPEELGFYRCHIKKPKLVDEGFDELLQGYGDFLTAKKKESKQERNKLRVQIEERVRKLLNRPDIDLKNLSAEEMQRIRNKIEPEYGIKAYKIHLLGSQIEFLDDKIEEFNSGARCVGVDQHAP